MSGDHIPTITALLGDKAVLLPIPEGTKSPRLKNWNTITLKETKAGEYQKELCTGNIGVLLGEPSAGLCAIDIDSDDAVEPFLQDNPQLRNTLRSKGARGQQIWLQVQGEYPKLTKLSTEEGNDFGEWRSTGGQSVIYGRHPTGVDYQIVENSAPVSVPFDSIKWPKNINLPWVSTLYDEIVATEGDPFVYGKGGAITLNHLFWVTFYATEHLVLYDSTLKDFYEYDLKDGLWKRETEDRVKGRFVQDLTKAAHEMKERGLLFKRNDALASSLVKSLRAHVEKPAVFQERRPIVHVRNGVLRLDLDPAALQSFHPDYYSRNVCPFDYDESAECPQFLEQLLGVALGADDISLLQRWCGSVLLGKNSAQRILLLLGTAGGGKSTLMEVLERVIGVHNVGQLRTEHLAERFELFGMVGKTLLTGKDVSASFLMHKGAHVLKALVGHDLMEGEKKGCVDRIQIRGDFNIGITCNSRLKVKLEGDTDAWSRRLLIVTYDKPKTTKRIANFASQLIGNEGPGILRWMVEGAQAHLDELKEQNGDFVLTEVQNQRVAKLLAESDSVRHFVSNAVETYDEGQLTTTELVTAYFDYCEQMGWDAFSATEVTRRLQGLMLEIHHVAQRHDIWSGLKQVRGYKKVALKGVGL